MAAIQSGSNTSNLADVDGTSKALRGTLYEPGGAVAVQKRWEAPAEIAGVPALGVNDGMLTGMRTDRKGGLATAWHNPLLIEMFENTTINPQRLLAIATTMAASQSSVAGLTINSTNITTVSTGYMIQSTKRFMKAQRNPLQGKFRARLEHYANSVIELGFGDAAAFNGANTNGAYFQITSSGVVQCVVTFNGVDGPVGTPITVLNSARYYVWDIVMDDDEILFTIQDTGTDEIVHRETLAVPNTAQRIWASSALGFQARVYNTAVAPATAPHMFLTDVYILDLDANKNKTWAQALAGMERALVASPFSGAQLHAWANSAEPANATLSNTAAGYTTLGGKFQFVAPVGATTDFALFGFQVPVPSNFVITGVTIDTWNLGAAVATTPHLLTWAIGVGSTAVSLATATVMRVPIGAQILPIGTVIGGLANRLERQFPGGLHCPSNRFIHVILRIPVGTATASQVIAGMVSFDGYAE